MTYESILKFFKKQISFEKLTYFSRLLFLVLFCIVVTPFLAVMAGYETIRDMRRKKG